MLDFPTRERFVRELGDGPYDIVGISAIVVNVGKVAEMCRLVRLHSPRATIATLRAQVHRELGGLSRVFATVGGPLLYWSARLEAVRHPRGRRLEPRTFVDSPA